MEFTDTHAHLDAFPSAEELESAIKRAKDANVSRIITCSARKCDWQNFSEMAKKYKGTVFWQMGIHPTEIEDGDEEFLENAKDFLKSATPPVSIGEIGLDFYKFEGSREEFEKMKSRQERLFKAQLEIAKNAGLPICVHARCAVEEAIKIIDESGFDWQKAVFHCFSGTIKQIEMLNLRGARASFTGIITYKNAEEMRQTMLRQGLSKIMFETDCPYLAPVPLRGKRNEPSYIPHIAQKAADLFGISLDEIAEISTNNAREFFGV